MTSGASSRRPSRCLPCCRRAIEFNPLFRGDVLVAALVRRSLKRILDVFLADGRRVTTTSVVDESLQVRASGFVEGHGHRAGSGVGRNGRRWLLAPLVEVGGKGEGLERIGQPSEAESDLFCGGSTMRRACPTAASFVLARFTMSEPRPSGKSTRHIFEYFSSRTTEINLRRAK